MGVMRMSNWHNYISVWRQFQSRAVKERAAVYAEIETNVIMNSVYVAVLFMIDYVSGST